MATIASDGRRKVLDYKSEGYRAYSDGRYTDAAHFFTCGIDLEKPESAELFTARSAAHIRLKAFRKAIEDAKNGALSDSTSLVKVYNRKGVAHANLQEWSSAARCFLSGLDHAGVDKQLSDRFDEAVENIRRSRLSFRPAYRRPLLHIDERVKIERKEPEALPPPPPAPPRRTLHDEFLSIFDRMYIKDILPKDPQQAQEVNRRVRELMWENYGKLRQMFRHYARQDAQRVKDIESKSVVADDLFTINQTEFQLFLRHCKIPNRSLNMAAINIIYILANRPRDADGNEIKDDENPVSSLIISEFFGCIVRMANLKYASSELDLADRTNILLEKDIIPNGHMDDAGVLRNLFNSEEIQSVVELYKEVIQGLFSKYAALDRRSALRSPQTIYTVNVREFVRLMEDLQLLDTKLSMKEVQTAFVECQEDPTSSFTDPDVISEMAPDNTCEMSIEEFSEGLCRCAVYKFRESADDPQSVDTVREMISEFLSAIQNRWNSRLRRATLVAISPEPPDQAPSLSRRASNAYADHSRRPSAAFIDHAQRPSSAHMDQQARRPSTAHVDQARRPSTAHVDQPRRPSTAHVSTSSGHRPAVSFNMQPGVSNNSRRPSTASARIGNS
mmetsp:Transcript_32724/g.53069  ORF Transcript_32724/g.53069 Transcript_32724/m.53069 type:complete len:616 (-) Transcript_32724:573-2420(-)